MGKPWQGIWGLTLLVALLVASTWAYVAWLFLPNYNQSRLDVGYTFGPYNSDFYQNWLPAREWFLHGQDPYSAEMTAAIQQGVYGRVLGFYGLLLIPSWVFYNQLLLYPAILLILQQRAVLAAAGALGRVAYGATLVCLLWFWVTATGLALVWAAATVLGASSVVATVAGIWQLPWISGLVLPTLLFLPLTILAWRTLARPGSPAAAAI